MVPVVALHDARPGDVDRDLPPFRRPDELGETAPRIHVHLQRIAELVFRQKREVGGVELLDERVRLAGHGQRLAPRPEAADQFRDLTQRAGIGRRDAGLHTGRLRILARRRNQAGEEGVDDIVDVDQRDRGGGIAHLDRQPAGDVVAPGGDGGVVVRPRPLAEHVRETEDAGVG